MKVKTAVFRNALAGGWGKVSIILVRLIQVPLILSALGVNNYGLWLVLSSIASWLKLANIGFGDVAANEIPMAIAAGDVDKAKDFFSTTIALVTVIGLVGAALTFLIVPFVPIESFLNISSNRHAEVTYAVIWLICSIFLSFYFDAFLGRFRAARKTHLSVIIASFFPWADLVAIIITFHFTNNFAYLGFGLLMSTLVCVLFYSVVSRLILPIITFSFKHVQLYRFRELFKKGLAFQAFPLGNALLFQGNLLIIQGVLGPAAVAVFGTARTLVRTLNQGMELINQAIWPELNFLFGSNDIVKAAKLHRAGVGISIFVSCFGAILLAIFGQALYHLWVGKSLQLPEGLLIVFLLPIPFNVLWYTSSVVHMATNNHEGLAKRYLIGTLLSVVACLFLSYFLGIEGAALSTLIADIILIPYVIKKSLELTNDSMGEFITGIFNEVKSAPALLKKFTASKKAT
ncbi:lipopolysaccharide biosynthesis protein [Mucilaginibacter sp.]|uniref:lipopolysaccharide biosynthesis protein n=1 Tax=Mucilaginibacter sp. TaxID=1882438 RepID=UPI003D0B2552